MYVRKENIKKYLEKINKNFGLQVLEKAS